MVGGREREGEGSGNGECERGFCIIPTAQLQIHPCIHKYTHSHVHTLTFTHKHTEKNKRSPLGRLTLDSIERGEKALLSIREAILSGDSASLASLSDAFYNQMGWNGGMRGRIDTVGRLQEVVDVLQIMRDMCTIQEGAGDVAGCGCGYVCVKIRRAEDPVWFVCVSV